MAPQPTATQETEKKSRPVFRISENLEAKLNQLVEREVEGIRAAGGIGVRPSHAQMVEALAERALREVAQPNGGEAASEGSTAAAEGSAEKPKPAK